jgi:hypothetical protein
MAKQRKTIEDVLSRIANKCSEFYVDDKAIQIDIRQALLCVKQLRKRERDAIKYETEIIPQMAEELRKLGFNPAPDETDFNIIAYFAGNR